jgi:hypothetical protein
MPGHYNNKGGLLRDSMMINVNPPVPREGHNAKLNSKPPEEPKPIQPPPSAERPPSSGSSESKPVNSESGSKENDTLILIGLGALLLFSYGMVK